MNWSLFISVFFLIFIAELPDKTALAAMMMATRGKPLAVFIGSAIAFLIQSAIAVLFGTVLGVLPARWVHLGAGLMFFAFAIYSWLHSEEADAGIEKPSQFGSPSSLPISRRVSFYAFAKRVWAAFLMIFIAEWADLTQLATASFAARYHHSLWTVFCSALLALWAASALVIYIGHRIKNVLSGVWLRYLTILIFFVAGAYFISSGFYT